MSRPRFLADHDLNEHIVTGVVRQEPTIEVLRARDLGLDDLPDSEVLAWAERERCLVVSHDVNTMPAAASKRVAGGQSFPGLFMVRQTLPVATAIESLVLIWAASELDEWKNQIIFIPFS